MKRLLAILASLSVASCDTSTKAADGTSSETQSALQALADNVRRTPIEPGTASGGSIAARGLSDSGTYCAGEQNWTSYGWLQAESYDGAIDWRSDASSEWAWISIRNELALDAGGAPIEGCHKGYMSARAQQVQMSKEGGVSRYDGLFWRDRDTGSMTDVLWEGVTRYPSGFVLAEKLYRKGPGMPLEVDTLREDTYSFAEGRFAFAFSSRDPVYGVPAHQREWEEAYEQSLPIVWCVPVIDAQQGGLHVGSVCKDLRNQSWTIRGGDGTIIVPAGTVGVPLDDSMGVRILSTSWDGDSLRIALRVQTAPFTLHQWSRTRVLVSDSVLRWNDDPVFYGWSDSLVFPDTNFVGPRRAEIALHRAALEGRSALRIELVRTYRSPQGRWNEIGTWWLHIPQRP